MSNSKAPLEKRVGRLRHAMEQSDCDCALLMVLEGLGWQNCYYFSGFRGSSAAIFITKDETLLVTDERYRLQASAQSPFDIVMQGNRPLYMTVKEMIEERAPGRVGVDGDRLPVSMYRKIADGWELEDFSSVFASLRRKKDSFEKANILEAARISRQALDKVINETPKPVREIDISAALEYSMKTLGADGGWQDHEFLVASGQRSALPHGRASGREIASGEWATVDFGARFSGYVCDVTRNLLFGEIKGEWLKKQEILLEAQEAAAAAIAPGVRAADIDAVARNVIERCGFGENFTHGLGHGIGLEIHEAPHLSPRSQDILQEGDVITLEPGIYFDREGGMRVEDDYLVTAEGSECLTVMIPKTLTM